MTKTMTRNLKKDHETFKPQINIYLQPLAWLSKHGENVFVKNAHVKHINFLIKMREKTHNKENYDLIKCNFSFFCLLCDNKK